MILVLLLFFRPLVDHYFIFLVDVVLLLLFPQPVPRHTRDLPSQVVVSKTNAGMRSTCTRQVVAALGVRS
jgi:hypothetical protein